MNIPSVRVWWAACAMIMAMVTNLVAQENEEYPTPDPEGTSRQFEETVRDALRAAGERAGEEGENPTGRHQWFLFQRSYPYPYIPAGIRAGAVRETRLFESFIAQNAANAKDQGWAAALAAPAVWENIGPFNIAGRIRAIIVHPTQNGTIFVGAASGGVWKNTGDQSDWTTTFDKQSALAIGSLEFDPSNPNIIYVGTGEVINSHTSEFNATPAYFGDGLFKSIDGGATWSHVGLSQLGTISDIYIRRDDSDIIYVTSAQGGGGLYRSIDGGENWTSLRAGVFFNIAVDPANEDHMVISSAGGILYSNDGGLNFDQATGFTPPRATRTSIALAPSNSSIGYALVAINNTGRSDSANLYKTTDGGVSWQLMKRFLGTFFNAQGHYNNCLAIHPTNPSIVLAGGIDIFRSTDGGTNWTNTTNVYNGGSTHPDQHVLVFDPNDHNQVYLGNDGGVYRSTNGGATWGEYSLALPITQYYEIGVDQSRNYRVYGGTQDNGTQGAYGTSSWAKDWIDLLGGDGFHVVMDDAAPNTIYAESQYGGLWRISASSPSTRNYISGRMDNAASSDYDPGSWSTPLAINQLTGALYSGRGSLWVSEDRGSSWSRQIPGNQANISTIGVSSLSAGDMMIGTTVGELYYTVSGGEVWNRADVTDNVPNRYITEIVYDPVNENRVYVVVSGTGASRHVLRSDNKGETFVDISSNLPDIPTNTMAVDPENTDILFVGNDVGVFVTLDGGNAWLPFNNGLPYVPVVDMEIHRSKRTLIVGTHGRSMWEVDIDNPQPQPIILSPFGGQEFESGDTLDIAWAGFGEPVRVLISYDGGRTFDTLGIVNDTTGVGQLLPFLRSSSSIVRIETIGGDRIVDSEPFSIVLRVNTDDRGTRGFVAGAIDVRENLLWAVNRNTNDIVQLRLPTLLPTGNKVDRSAITGEIVDLAYDPAGDRFFLLTGSIASRSGTALSIMSPTGELLGTVPLPEASVSGVAITPDGLTVITPGNQGRIYLLNPEDGSVISQSQGLGNGFGTVRTGLVWDGDLLAQGVDDAVPGGLVEDALQRIENGPNPVVTESIPLVVENDTDIEIIGLAFYRSPTAPFTGTYYVTDTNGYFYIIDIGLISGVTTTEYRDIPSSIDITTIAPNPFRSETTVTFTTGERGSLMIDAFDDAGRRVYAETMERLEAGTHELELDFHDLPSGVYSLVITGENGDRAMRKILLMR